MVQSFKQSFTFLFLLAFCLVFAGCPTTGGGTEGAGVITGGSSDTGSTSGDSGESTTGGSATGEDTSGSSDDTTTEEVPQISIAAPPALTTPTTTALLTYAGDSNDFVTTDGSVDSSMANYYLAASTEPVTQSADRGSPFADRHSQFATRDWRSTIRALRSTISDLRSTLLRSAHADTSGTMCDTLGISYSLINSDGSLANPIYVIGNNSSTIHYYYSDCNTAWSSTPATQMPNPNALWFAQKSNSLGVADTVSGSSSTLPVWVVGEGMGLGIQDINDVPAVYGSYNNLYRNFDTSGDQLTYDPSHNFFGIKDSANGIYINSFDGTNVTARCQRTESNTAQYNFVKYTTEGQMRFGTRLTAPDNVGRFPHALDRTDCDPDPSSDNYITFLNNDLATDGTYLQALNLIAGDVDDYTGYNTAVVIFTDSAGTYHIRMSNPTAGTAGVRKGGEAGFNGSYDFRDLIIYHTQNGTDLSANAGKFLIPDYANNAIWQGSYFIDWVSDISHSITDSLNASTNAINITGPQTLVLNNEKTIAYVLKSDNTAVGFPLTDSAGTLLTVAQMNEHMTPFNLADVVSGKSVTLTPHGMTYFSRNGIKRLFFGAQGINGGLIWDVTSYESTALPAPASSSESGSGSDSGSGGTRYRPSSSGSGSGTITLTPTDLTNLLTH